ncbi:hypothetical protein CLU79DRAFT_762609 [Phycomyces nitens]|nr:hypothetical protein CLU79DRAFT_762609 [Phycomyces nitens]
MTSPTTPYNYTPDLSDNNKRKKASRACFHCQKAHLTCDDSRPCQRCIKRDLAATCTDAARKKAKYLQDLVPQDNYNRLSYPEMPDALNNSHFVDTSDLFNFSMGDLDFGSETAGLEYGFIGNMLQTPLDLQGTLEDMSATHHLPAFHSTSIPTATHSPMANNFPLRTSFGQPVQSPLHPQPSLADYSSPSSTLASAPTSTPLPAPVAAPQRALTANRRRNITAEEAYQSVQRPFNYAKGFHYLIQYVRDRMGQDDLMRISRALALFRPSFLALIMNLTEEDLIFMEKCLQRTLLEYEKLISFSGTPTVVWRRTGEVCLVGKEFSLLTQWSKDMLMHRKTYIYELMDNQSAVEYWEKFATHAFDNTDKSCIYSCILRTPHQKAVPCTFCFTIKRDIFDLPSVIVGNFLPILG